MRRLALACAALALFVAACGDDLTFPGSGKATPAPTAAPGATATPGPTATPTHA